MSKIEDIESLILQNKSLAPCMRFFKFDNARNVVSSKYIEEYNGRYSAKCNFSKILVGLYKIEYVKY